MGFPLRGLGIYERDWACMYVQLPWSSPPTLNQPYCTNDYPIVNLAGVVLIGACFWFLLKSMLTQNRRVTSKVNISSGMSVKVFAYAWYVVRKLSGLLLTRLKEGRWRWLPLRMKCGTRERKFRFRLSTRNEFMVARCRGDLKLD